MNGKQRIEAALRREPVDRTPVWFMRQAGRYLPEYRALKEQYSFTEMVKSPELALEVTLQPLHRFSQIDAAIIFSDILVIPEALGMGYTFREEGGIAMEFEFQTQDHLNKLQLEGAADHLSYVYDALNLVSAELNDEKALLGFGGSPWTLATYMVEGGSSKDFAKIKSMIYEQPVLLESLLDLITQATTAYFKRIAECGVSAIQVFDSWGCACPGGVYWQWSLKWIKQIIDSLECKVPVILFSKGMGAHLESWRNTGASAFSLDSSLDLMQFADYPERDFALQGNLDPHWLNLKPEVVAKATADILTKESPIQGHIFNLGHGILPQANLESVHAMLETVDAHKS